MSLWTHAGAFGLGLFLGGVPFLAVAAILAGNSKRSLHTLASDLLNPEDKMMLGQALTFEGLGESIKREHDIIMGKNVDQGDLEDVDPLGPENEPESPGWRPGGD